MIWLIKLTSFWNYIDILTFSFGDFWISMPHSWACSIMWQHRCRLNTYMCWMHICIVIIFIYMNVTNFALSFLTAHSKIPQMTQEMVLYLLPSPIQMNSLQELSVDQPNRFFLHCNENPWSLRCQHLPPIVHNSFLPNQSYRYYFHGKKLKRAQDLHRKKPVYFQCFFVQFRQNTSPWQITQEELIFKSWFYTLNKYHCLEDKEFL